MHRVFLPLVCTRLQRCADDEDDEDDDEEDDEDDDEDEDDVRPQRRSALWAVTSKGGETFGPISGGFPALWLLRVYTMGKVSGGGGGAGGADCCGRRSENVRASTR